MVLATMGCVIMIDWPYIYTHNNCKDYSINEPVQLATVSESTCDISSLCYPLDISHHSLPFYINSSNSSKDNIVYSVTYEHVCRVSTLDITNTNVSCYISCTSDTNECKIGNNICRNSTDPRYNDICYVTIADTNQDMCGEQDSMSHSDVLDMLFNSTDGYKEYNITLSGIEYVGSIANKWMQCEEDEKCYWNPDSIVTGEYCFNCPTLCRLKNGLHFSQVIVALLLFVGAAMLGRTILYPILSKASPKHIQVSEI